MKTALFALLSLTLCASVAAAPQAVPYRVLESKPRPADHFTQGLYFDGERWLESSGLYGRSWLAEYTDPGGNPVRRKWLASNRFAEGLAVFGDYLYLLTYRAGELQIYDRRNFQLVHLLHYSGEGWGLTSDGESLIMSNGSDTLTFRTPDGFKVTRSLKVSGGGQQWSRLNELEYANGLIWANIWQDTRIIAIDPHSGEVQGWVDLKTLQEKSLPGRRHVDAVANGIAWDKARNGLWVTGKLWPRLYLIRPRGLGFEGENQGTEKAESAR